MRGAGILVGVALVAACTATAPPTVAAITAGAIDADDPAVVALVDATGTVGCTATAVGPHAAITAAHCIAGRDPRTLRAFFGTSTQGGGGTFVTISDGRAHPDFDPTTLAHDIAMLALRDPSPAAPLALEPAPLDASLVGTPLRAVGFGTTAAASADAGTKRATTAQISDVAADELTATPDPGQPCHGDSGGPAILPTGTLAAVVSHGDDACIDHATYARLDVARAPFIDPYLASIASGTVSVGDACLYDGQCTGGPCLVTTDDPLLAFCSQACTHDDDCPATMTCADDGCRFPTPSPGALGSPCDGDAQCTTQRCRDAVCTLDCFTDPSVCPAGFACRGSGLDFDCLADTAPAGCGCTSGDPGGAIMLVVVIAACARARRSARSASPRGSRAPRSR